MPHPAASIAPRSRSGFGLRFAAVLALAAAPTLAAQQGDSAVERVEAAAFRHWWPKYERLMQILIENQDVDAGRLRVPPPTPASLREEIEVGAGARNRYLPGYTFYGVHTQGSVFQGLFLMDPSGAVAVLVNHDDPEDRKPIIEDAYVDHMNRILAEANVEVDGAEEAVSLARFFLSTFFNFTVHPEEVSVDSLIQDELQRVRVVSSYREIPQGRRELRFGSQRAFLAFTPVPEAMRTAIGPPRVSSPQDGSYRVQLFTWHPVRGELKDWDIFLRDGQFVYFRDRTIGSWRPYRFSGME
ncbi:MAG: hypothetical protein ABR599_05445 [Gemmatimonadota bacterium]